MLMLPILFTISLTSRSGVIAMTYSFWAGDTSRRNRAAAIMLFASLFMELIESQKSQMRPRSLV
ncbi:MAG: hypothetical protein BWY82_01050 [Verrucomicrobia bacterium ADurb.Bin474]|nr:MAG: hypothetical protein BWY82_01050 [Verrucomicrobia bacterium ADurb.Bin474]